MYYLKPCSTFLYIYWYLKKEKLRLINYNN